MPRAHVAQLLGRFAHGAAVEAHVERVPKVGEREVEGALVLWAEGRRGRKRE